MLKIVTIDISFSEVSSCCINEKFRMVSIERREIFGCFPKEIKPDESDIHEKAPSDGVT